MPFQYGCFISYAHDADGLISTFISTFTQHLRDHLYNLEAENKVWLDEQRMGGGTAHPEAIATAMCHSACWVLVYIPKYRRKPFCTREFNAMKSLEEKRRRDLPEVFPRTSRMIIPVVLGGAIKDLPRDLTDSQLAVDFTKMRVRYVKQDDMRQFDDRVKRIAEHIWDIWRLCEHLPDHPGGCDAFKLPDEPDMSVWGPEVGGPAQGRPM